MAKATFLLLAAWLLQCRGEMVTVLAYKFFENTLSCDGPGTFVEPIPGNGFLGMHFALLYMLRRDVCYPFRTNVGVFSDSFTFPPKS